MEQNKYKDGKFLSIGFLVAALAVYCRSPAAYAALLSFKMVQLPCVRTANLEGAGDCTPRIKLIRTRHVRKMLEKNEASKKTENRYDKVA